RVRPLLSLHAAVPISAAELCLNRVPQDWNLANNQRPVGNPLVMSYTAPRGASARVTITRVSGVSFWVVSEGTAGALGSQATARRSEEQRSEAHTPDHL